MRFEPVVRRVAAYADRPRIVTARAVFDLYSAAGGGLLAGGLAFSALFALLPGVLLLTAILGLVVEDPVRRGQIIDALAGAVPPLTDLIRTGATSFSAGAIQFSIVGFVGLVWGSSRFYAAIDEALARIFVGAPRRNVVSQTVRGLMALAALVGGLVAFIVVERTAEELAGGRLNVGSSAAGVLPIALNLGLLAVSILALTALFELIPTIRPRWADIWLPVVVCGSILALFTRGFVLIEPRILGSAAVYAAFVAVFAAMVWLSTAFQLVLIGAAWVRVRQLGRLARLEAG